MNTLFEELTVGGELPATSTHQHRAWAWLPNANKDAGLPGHTHDGHLSITLQKGRKVGCKIERDAYLVECQPPVPGFLGRAFLLSNATDPAAEEVYETLVGVRPGEGTCTCPAGKYKAPSCKHRDALRAAIAAGAFPEAKQSEPQPRRGPWQPSVSGFVTREPRE